MSFLDFFHFQSDRVPGGNLPLGWSSDESLAIAQPIRSVLVPVTILDLQWVFPLTKDSFREGVDSPIAQLIEYFFPVGFIPNRKAKHVRFRFENEDGSYWGGEEVDLVARFDEFFKWGWTAPNGSSQPTRWHRPTWLTLRAWQILKSQVSKRNWDDVPPSELTIEVCQARKGYFDNGMYQEHGFPVRLILTLE